MVKQVEHLGSKLNSVGFLEASMLDEGEINVPATWTFEQESTRITQHCSPRKFRVRSGHGKGSPIEVGLITPDGVARVGRSSRDDVGARRPAVAVLWSSRKIERVSASSTPDSCDLPSSKETVVARGKGKLPHKVGQKVVTNVIEPCPALQEMKLAARTIRPVDIRVSVKEAARLTVCRVLADGMPPGVIGYEVQTLSDGSSEGHLHGMIVGKAVTFVNIDAATAGIDPCAPTRLRRIGDKGISLNPRWESPSDKVTVAQVSHLKH